MITERLTPRTITLLGMALGLCLGVVSEAHAYRVKKVCEEVLTKQGFMQKCRTVLDKSEPDEKVPEKKAEEKKKSSGKH